MKSKVMNRPMFLDVENVGIMQGFKDDDMAPEDSYETGQMIDRTPGSPEILMNNLRGDMRSIDARLDELAQLVGEDVAMDTPPEVLALLQPVLAQQEGIASLPAGMPPMDPSMMPPSPMEAALPAPDMGMMPPDAGMMPPIDPSMMPPGAPPMMPPPDAGMMPQGPMPTAQAPLQMAQGGYVQRFRDGSDEEGVTPDDEDSPPSADPGTARAMLSLMSQSGALPTLGEEFQRLLPTYQEALGAGDRSMTRAQMLFDIAQAGLNLAAGTDAQGRPVRGSFASRLAGAAQQVPERIAARAGQMRQEEQGMRLAALRGAETSIEAQRRAYAEMMKGESLFGKGSWEWNIINKPGLIDRWARDEVTAEEETLVQSAIAKLSEPRTEYRTDPITRQLMPVQITTPLPNFLLGAMMTKGQSPSVTPPVGTGAPGVPPATEPPIPPDAIPMGEPSGRTEPRDPDAYVSPTAGEVEAAQTEVASQEEEARRAAGMPSTEPPVFYSTNEPTLFNAAAQGVGIINVPSAWLYSKPFIGSLIVADEEADAVDYINNTVRTINRAFATNPRFAEGERQQIAKEVNLAAKAIDRPEAFRVRLVALDRVLRQLRRTTYSQAYENPNLAPEDIANARRKLMEIDEARSFIGAPPYVFTEEEANALPPGSWYVWQGQRLARRGEATNE